MDGKALNERRFFRDKNGQFFSDLLRMSSVVKKLVIFFFRDENLVFAACPYLPSNQNL